MGVPKGFGGGKVDSGCIHDGNRERLSGDYELHEKHVGFLRASARNPVTGRLQNNSCISENM